jgi:hypothetical protein
MQCSRKTRATARSLLSPSGDGLCKPAPAMLLSPMKLPGGAGYNPGGTCLGVCAAEREDEGVDHE